ncbi:hypothetical protein D0T12_33170 [Actinomadura spongiicola]|uniref:Uncharacterized protein n=1 Tax=Actinomadura spongiicola TaxID=2303421 RepID=A0A372G762_9ACTN|nr:hypothetical protein [Actinomadura spongiicola]RFS81225.1 hypothetical protein D0T12_33170 [Actinomadura spongiicola]
MNDHQQARTRLAALKERLAVHDSELKLEDTELNLEDTLLVTAPVNDAGRRFCVLVMCGPRADDHGKLWFWLHGPPEPHPLTEAERVIDAAAEISDALRSAL